MFGRVSEAELATDPQKLVAIAVALTSRPKLSPDEEISLRHLEHYLAKYDKYFIAAKGMSVPRSSGFGVKKFDNKYFGSVQAHTNMLLSQGFYKEFLEYKYLLIYHLDALVFSDRLEYWCEQGYDFIGGPLQVAGANQPNQVGNGGFSLRNIRSCLKVLRSRVPFQTPEELKTQKNDRFGLGSVAGRYVRRLGFFNNIQHEIRRSLSTVLYDDIFFCTRGRHYYPDFRVAPLDIALDFAYDEGPAICFEMKGGRLPFGCHGWYKHDRKVWEPYLLT